MPSPFGTGLYTANNPMPNPWTIPGANWVTQKLTGLYDTAKNLLTPKEAQAAPVPQNIIPYTGSPTSDLYYNQPSGPWLSQYGLHGPLQTPIRW